MKYFFSSKGFRNGRKPMDHKRHLKMKSQQSSKEPLHRRVPTEFVMAWEAKHLQGQEWNTLEDIFVRKVVLENKLRVLGRFDRSLYLIVCIAMASCATSELMKISETMTAGGLKIACLMLSFVGPNAIALLPFFFLWRKIRLTQEAIDSLSRPLKDFRGCVVGIIDPKTGPQYVEREYSMKRLKELAGLLVGAERETRIVRLDMNIGADKLFKLCTSETSARRDYKECYAKLAQMGGYYNLPPEDDFLSQVRAELAT
jgi:hypothetical protein